MGSLLERKQQIESALVANERWLVLFAFILGVFLTIEACFVWRGYMLTVRMQDVQKQLDNENDLKIAGLALEVAGANERASASTKEAEEAKRRAAELELKTATILESMKWRHVTLEDRAKIKESLIKSGVKDVMVFPGVSQPEVVGYSMEIFLAIQSAGAAARDSRQLAVENPLGHQFPIGVFVVIPAVGADDEITGAAQKLVSALRDGGVSAIIYSLQHFPRGRLVIEVGCDWREYEEIRIPTQPTTQPQ
jgi:hypothetical protein